MNRLQQPSPAPPPQPHPDTEPTPDEATLRLLRLLEERPSSTQRELSEHLGMSLGKLNYCLRALIGRGWVKTNNFRRSDQKMAYAYVLTPDGLARKLAVTRLFLQAKQAEYEALKRTIEQLQREVGKP